ncbi:HpcH/HpaI aldolase family protein [Salinarimonas soli]|uniref:Hydroxyacid aldolase n=1 Tax=Salinarimonas soli TaxID=1638099 RepID=A0A5B2V8U0_9HYPH|nr:aldolase/citrate lyase family protein [Salinarimonas soli]KAA2234647.1 hydroxyacid aldolase [Salinarimonas soli]
MSPLIQLSDRLTSGPLFTAWCGLPDPAVPGLLAREGFDAVTIDMQHGAIDFAATVRAIPLVGAAGKPAVVRVPVGEFATASRLLDAGAAAIIAPMINTVEDARRLAAYTKFPPLGERSWGPHGALALSGLAPKDYFAQANGFSVTFAMIETREALAIVDDILAVDGIDAIFVGPSDLSIALSGGASLDPASREVEAAMDHVIARARAAGRFIGVYAASGERGAQLAAKGFDLIALGSDSAMLRAGAAAALKAVSQKAGGTQGAY